MAFSGRDGTMRLLTHGYIPPGPHDVKGANHGAMRLLVPTAGPRPARQNARYVVELARRLKAELDVVHIIEPSSDRGAGQAALAIFEEAGREKGVAVHTHLVEGGVVPTIVRLAAEMHCSLIVMGGSSGRLVAEWIVSDVMSVSPVPIVIIPYAENESP
jgi:nucleotide-binding universal stress UspA family protein